MELINKPLIIGGSHHNTYGLIRCFGEAGIKVDLILYECKDSYIGYSKYVDNLWYCDSADDAVRKVSTLVNNEDSHFVVFSATDAVASLMDLHFHEFARKCSFFNAGEERKLTCFMNKEVQTDVAFKLGFKVPKTASFSKGEHIEFDVFPCIIKPLASIEGGKHIVVCHSQEDIDAKSNQFINVEKVLVQQYLYKEQEIVMLGLATKGNIIIPGYIIKFRDIMGGTTYSRTAPISELDADLEIKVRNLVAAMNYEGLFGIELIKSANNYYFIEMNLRNDATTYSMAVAGCNLPLLYWNIINNDHYCGNFSYAVRQITSIVEFNDFIHVLKRHVSLFSWLRQRQKSECKYFYSKEDLRPYKIKRIEFIKFVLKMLFKRFSI